MPGIQAESVLDWPTVTREDLFSVTGTVAAEESQNMLSQLPSLHSLKEEEPHETLLAMVTETQDLGASFRYKLSGSLGPSQEDCRALFVGTDEDFLQNEVMRELFALNALSPEESQLLEIPESVLRREGIILESLLGNGNNLTEDAFEEEDEVEEEEEEGAVCPGESLSAWPSMAESSLAQSSPVGPSREEGLDSPSMNLGKSSASSSIRLSIHSDTDRLVVPQGEEYASYGAVQQPFSVDHQQPLSTNRPSLLRRFQTPLLAFGLLGLAGVSATLVSVSKDGLSLGLSLSLLILSCILLLIIIISLAQQQFSTGGRALDRGQKDHYVEMQSFKKTVSGLV
jgi:hypothetical protein